MKKRFDYHNWKPTEYLDITDASDIILGNGPIKRIRTIGKAEGLDGDYKYRAFHFGLQSKSIQWFGRSDIYEKYQDDLIYPLKLSLYEPVIVEFENNNCIEIVAHENEIYIAENSISENVVDGINDSNISPEILFDDINGKKIVSLYSSKDEAHTFDGDFLPNMYNYKIHILWLDDGQGLFFIGTWDADFYFGILTEYNDFKQRYQVAMTSLKKINEAVKEQSGITIVPGHDGSSFFWIMPIKPAECEEEKVYSDLSVCEYRKEEISIEEDDIYNYLSKYLSDEFDPSIQDWARTSGGPGFEWNLEYNVYTIEQIKEILAKIKNDMSNIDIYSDKGAIAFNFYERFVWRMKIMLEHTPKEYNYISFMGP